MCVALLSRPFMLSVGPRESAPLQFLLIVNDVASIYKGNLHFRISAVMMGL